jgi:hypothetical protein
MQLVEKSYFYAIGVVLRGEQIEGYLSRPQMSESSAKQLLSHFAVTHPEAYSAMYYGTPEEAARALTRVTSKVAGWLSPQVQGVGNEF